MPTPTDNRTVFFVASRSFTAFNTGTGAVLRDLVMTTNGVVYTVMQALQDNSVGRRICAALVETPQAGDMPEHLQFMGVNHHRPLGEEEAHEARKGSRLNFVGAKPEWADEIKLLGLYRCDSATLLATVKAGYMRTRKGKAMALAEVRRRAKAEKALRTPQF